MRWQRIRKRTGAPPLTREIIHARIRRILSETRGCDEDDCELEARIFGDLGLESIDLLEVSFQMEEAFGFPYPTDEVGAVFNLARGGEDPAVFFRDVQRRVRESVYIDLPDNLPGLDPFNETVFQEAVRDLLTVGHLVDFVENTLAKRVADEVELRGRGYLR